MKDIPSDYEDDVDNFFLGKNRRLAETAFLPACKRADQMKFKLGFEESHTGANTSRSLKEHTQTVLRNYGWGQSIRYPPGGPLPSFPEYLLNLEAMTKDVLRLWHLIKTFSEKNEDHVQEWILKAARSDNRSVLKDVIRKSWRDTVQSFNNCSPEVKTFMEPKYTESDFLLGDTEITQRHGAAFIHINSMFKTSEVHGPGKDVRKNYHVAYRHRANFWDERKGWPLKDEPPPKTLPHMVCNVDGRKFYREQRAMFLVPQINEEDLVSRANILAFIHYRARLHPWIFAKMDNDNTYLGRRTKYITGPTIFNRMVTFEMSSETYVPKPHNHCGRYDDNRTELTNEQQAHNKLFDTGRLFGTAEAWVFLQGQRAVYNFIWHLIQNLSTMVGATSVQTLQTQPRKNQRHVYRSCFKRVQKYGSRKQGIWSHRLRFRQYSNPPTQISLDYFAYLEAKVTRADEKLCRLFREPEFFFNAVMEMKEHHWTNIGVKRDDDGPDEMDSYPKYMENYADEATRHALYYDLMRAVVRRAVFEHFMWRIIWIDLHDFIILVCRQYLDYALAPPPGKNDDVYITHPPNIIADGAYKDWEGVTTYYAFIVMRLRYCAVYFVNEFRKKGIHAGSKQMRDLVYGVGPVQEDVRPNEPLLCPIPKGHSHGPGVNYRSKLPNAKKCPDVKHDTRLFVFEAINTFIADPMDSSNCPMNMVTSVLGAAINHLDMTEYDKVFSDMTVNTIQNLDLLANLAEHMEMLWPIMPILSRPHMDEASRRLLVDLSMQKLSINFELFDSFDFDKKVPQKRLQRLFLFFDEMQGFKPETISIGHAMGDLRRFGASIFQNVILPINQQDPHKAAGDGVLDNLGCAMGIKRDSYPFHEDEVPINFHEERKEPGFQPFIIKQPKTHRSRAANERQLKVDLRKRRTAYGDAVANAISGPSKEEQAREKKRLKKLKRRKAKKKLRSGRSGSASSSSSSSGSASASSPMVAPKRTGAMPAHNDRKFEESVHFSMKGFPVFDDKAFLYASSSDQEDENMPDAANADDPAVITGIEALALDPESDGEIDRNPNLVVPDVRREFDELYRNDDEDDVEGEDAAETEQETEPETASLPPGTAPDGNPKKELKKRVWATLEAVYGVHGTINASVSYADLTKALEAIGYQEQGRGGSHNDFIRQGSCRWPQGSLPKGNTFQVAKNHEGKHAAAAKGKARDWGKRFEQKALTLAFIEKWYKRPENQEDA